MTSTCIVKGVSSRLAALLAGGTLVSVAACSVFGDFSGFSSGLAEGGTSENKNGDAGGSISGSDGGSDGQPTANPDVGLTSEAPFIDAFDRPNGPVGNGWLEKVSGRFSIIDQTVSVFDGNWRRHILYRPTEENVLDVEISAEIRWTSVTPAIDCDATLMARLVPQTLTTNNDAAGYAVYINDTIELTLARLEGGSETKLRDANLPSSINTTDTYRMTLRVRGTSPVMLDAMLDRRESNGTWTNVQTISAEDDRNDRIQTPGSVGMTADVHSSFRYDNFTRTKL